MIGIIGTVPDLAFPLMHGLVHLDGECLILEGQTIPIHRGTPALLAAAVAASEWINGQDIYAFLVGDTGKGEGSRHLYQFIEAHLPEVEDMDVLTFHYLQPDVDWHNKVLFSIEGMSKRPLLIADAGFMYAAKMSGQASMYDLFTPDAGELAFLADEFAPHPFYTRGFILYNDDNIEELIQRAYQHQNASTYLMVKGKKDMIADKSRILDTIDSPLSEAMEAIGGTGDTLTGLLTTLCGFGYTPPEAAGLAARTNRWIGYYANPSPETQVAELIACIPRALSKVLGEFHKEVPYRRFNEKAAN
jgi:NAD(P)H-hydrate repair Nnr-like enzyme with NAD(P)H-hydrate dehydratase domain